MRTAAWVFEEVLLAGVVAGAVLAQNDPHAGHGFLRQQTGRDGANMRASEKAWIATLTFLRENLR